MSRYSIAGLAVEMEPVGRLLRQAAPYAVPGDSGPADLTIACDLDRIIAGSGWICDRDTAEYMGTGTLFARGLLDFGGFQLHASAVELAGRAWLFSGPSGIGKSTLAGRWVRMFGALWLNDDKPALRRSEGLWRAWGTPWSGKHDLSRPASAPVGAAVFLRRGEGLALERLTPYEALPLFMSQVPRSLEAAQVTRLLELADQFLGKVPIWRLTCGDDDGGALLSRRTLLEEGSA